MPFLLLYRSGRIFQRRFMIMNKMKILVTYAGVWKMDNGQSGMTLNYLK